MWPKLCSFADRINSPPGEELMTPALTSRTFDICAIGLLLLAYLVVLRLPSQRFPDTTEYVPAEALVFVEQEDPLVVARSLLESPLGRKLLALQPDQPFPPLGEIAVGMPMLLTTLRVINKVMAEPSISEVGLRHLSLALLPPLEGGPPSPSIEEQLRDNLIFWAQARGEKPLAEILAGDFRWQSVWRDSGSSQYGRHRIRRIRIGEQTISLVELGTTLAFSFNERHLRRCIDVYDGERPSLAVNSDKLLLKINGHRSQPRRRVIVKTAPLAKAYLPEEIRPSILPLLETIAYRQDDGDGHDRHHLLFTDDSVRVIPQFGLHSMLAFPGLVLVSLSKHHVMMWLSSNSLSLATLLDARPQDRDGFSFGEFEAVIKALRRGLGDGMELLNRQVLFSADTNLEEHPLAIPLMLASATINHPEEILQPVEELAALYRFPLTLVEQGPLRYWYWSQAPMEGLVPLYGTFGSTLFLGNSRKLVERLFADGGPSALPGKNDSFANLTRPLLHDSNLLLFIDHQQVFAEISKGLQVMVILKALEDRQLALQYGELFATVLGPLLESWQEPRRSLSRVRFDEGSIEVEMISISTK